MTLMKLEAVDRLPPKEASAPFPLATGDYGITDAEGRRGFR